MTTILSDLSQDLVEEILCTVPITSLGAVRSTCKRWNALTKDRILCKTEPKQQFIGFMRMEYRLCSIRFNLHGILNEDFVAPSIKPVSDILKQAKISKLFSCKGLLLCLTMNNSGLTVWNPYLGQTRWIKSKTMTETIYDFGYDDNNNNHKILRIFHDHRNYYQIYDLKPGSWRGFNVIPSWDIDFYHGSASVNGNTYFWTKERIEVESSDDSDSEEDEDETPSFLICFDFTAERFGQFLPLPFDHKSDDYGTLSAYIIGENRHLKKVGLGEVVAFSNPLMCSYVPSLVQINQIACEKKRKRTNEF